MPKKKLGCGPVAVLFMLVAILLMTGANEIVGIYFGNCDDEDVFECLVQELQRDDEEEEEPEGSVSASGVYEYKGYSVTITAIIPLAGGDVTGNVTGTCEGTLKGTYNGQNNGPFTGTIGAACSPLFVNIPSSATFTASVNKTAKTVPFSFVGKGGGMTHEGSMTLAWQEKEPAAE